jgi:NAD(P)H-dependent FMN reductase
VNEVPLRVAVIVGSTREGRVGDTVAGWITTRARLHGDLAVDMVDLADFSFPSRFPKVPTPAMLAFTALLAAADAFVVVTPEYNRSFPASLKQAIDFGYDEWRAKAAGFVSYGCGSIGLYAVEQLRMVFTELHVVTVRDSVGFNLMAGDPLVSDGSALAATTMLDQLCWWGLALRDARRLRPYVS